jgi:hypothetical protein
METWWELDAVAKREAREREIESYGAWCHRQEREEARKREWVTREEAPFLGRVGAEAQNGYLV